MKEMELNDLKQKYNDLLQSYKSGVNYKEEHPEEIEKVEKRLKELETEMQNILNAIPDVKDGEITEGFTIEEVKKTDVQKTTKSTAVIVKQEKPTNKLSNFSESWQIATQLAKSTIIPENYKGKPENIIIAIGLANQMQLDPFTVMQNLAIIKGKTSWSGSFCKTLIERTGKYKNLELNYVGEKGKDSYGCYLSAIRVSDNKKIDGPIVTMAIAKAEKWTSNPKWLTLTDLMLAYRCQSFFCRLYVPEAMNGIYTSEEVEEINTSREQPQDIL